MSFWDEEPEKVYTTEEILIMVEIFEKTQRKTKCITIFLTSILAPIITNLCLDYWINHPAMYLIAPITLMLASQAFDDTYDSILKKEYDDEYR